MTLYPLKRLTLGAQSSSQLIVLDTAGGSRGCCGGSLWPQMALMSAAGQLMFSSLLSMALVGPVDGELAARIPAIYFALHLRIVALFMRMRNISCHRTVAATVRNFQGQSSKIRVKVRILNFDYEL